MRILPGSGTLRPCSPPRHRFPPPARADEPAGSWRPSGWSCAWPPPLGPTGRTCAGPATTGCPPRPARTGASLWSVNVRDRFGGKGWEFGYAATPLVEGDRVVLPVGGPAAGLVALHADDGRTLWAAGSDPASYCPALPVTFQGRRCVV